MSASATGRAPIIVGSSIAFVIGATIMIALHESAHAVAGAVQGFHPTQLPFAVDYTPEPPVEAEVIALLAGPVFSLVSGFAGIAIDRAVRPFRSRPLWRMVWLWTVFASVQEGLGYLQITAIFQAGDTAQAFTLLNAPPVVFILATVIGWACLPLTAWLFSAPIRELSSSVSDKRSLVVWPWMIGTGGLLVLMAGYVLLSPSVGADAVVAVLAGALAVGVYAPMSMMFGTQRFGAAESPRMPWPPTTAIAVLVVLVLLNVGLTRAWLWP